MNLLLAAGPSELKIAVVLVAVIVFVVVLALVFNVVGIWLRAAVSSAKVSIWSLVGMKFRRVNPALIVDARIRLVKARVTVRANIDRLVGGASEETIIARVGQGIVSAIGSANTYKDVLENPDRISARVLEAGLDSQTGFEIVSIDIADISVAGVSDVANVGARLETERANADKQLRQAEAEGRRAMAVAREQEMRATVQEMQARVVEARAEVPKAMAQALREGKLGVMDYYRLQNIESDTDMRRAIAGPGQHPDNAHEDGDK